MKQLLTLLLLATITATAYADKNHKAEAKPKTVKPEEQQQPTATPATNTPNTDTAWHGTGTHYDYGQRSYDARTARYGYIDIDSATAAKYGCTRPTMPVRSSNPYQSTTNNPAKLDK